LSPPSPFAPIGRTLRHLTTIQAQPLHPPTHPPTHKRSTPHQATKGFLSNISRYAGVALQNETFVRQVFDYLVVPGKAWTAAELAAAAPIQLKTL